MRKQWQYFLLAVGFFTRIPVPSQPSFEEADLNGAVKYFPLVGCLVGAGRAGRAGRARKRSHGGDDRRGEPGQDAQGQGFRPRRFLRQFGPVFGGLLRGIAGRADAALGRRGHLRAADSRAGCA